MKAENLRLEYVGTYRAEYRQSQMGLASLLGRYTADNFRAIVQCLFAMERALFARESLHNYFGIGG